MQTLQVHELIQESIAKAMSYQEYLDLMAKLVAEGSSTFPTPSDDMAMYTKLNYKRMLRLNKTLTIAGRDKDFFESYNKKVTWLVLTESWCGDAAQIIPVLNKMASLNANIHLRLVLRDQNLELMDLCLTNGTRSIPKLLLLNTDYDIINTFGPRPEDALRLVDDFRQQYGKLTPDFKQYLQLWYNKDKGKSVIKEMIALLQ